MVLGILFAFLATLGFGSSAVFARLGLQKISLKVGTLISVTTSFLFTAVFMLAFNAADIPLVTGIAVLWFLAYGLITFPIARFLNYKSLNMAGATRATPILALNPIFATILAMWLLGERPNLLIGIGVFVTVIGLGLIVSEQRPSAD